MQNQCALYATSRLQCSKSLIEFNIRRHYETHHKDKCDYLIEKIRKNEMKRISCHLLLQYVKVKVRDSGCKHTLFRPLSIGGPLSITND